MARDGVLQLPAILVSKADVGRLRRELEALEDYLHQAALRHEKPADIKLPKTSRLLDEFAGVNKLDLLRRGDHEVARTALAELADSAPVLHVSFSAEPSSAFLAKLIIWLRQNIHPSVLVQVGLEPSIGAGCIVRTANHEYDLSLGQSFAKNRELLVQQLHGEVPA